MPSYEDLLPDDTTPSGIEEGIYDDIRAHWPEWEPSDGSLEVWIIKALSLRLSEIYQLTVDVADEVFMQGGPAVGYPRHEAEPATVTSTWTMLDDSGYTVLAGAAVEVQGANGPIAFETVTDLVVDQGNTSGAVDLIAIQPGAEGNGLTGDATLIDAFAFVDTVTLNAPSSGGSDQEKLGEYLDRLVRARRMLSVKAITASEFAVLAEQDARVDRAVGIHGLDPTGPTEDVPLTTTVVVMDEDGQALSSGTKGEIRTALESGTVVGMDVFVTDADYTTVDVTAAVVTHPGFDHATVVAQVEAEITSYLDPANWGRTEEDGLWENQDTVRYLELASLIDRITGVDYVSSLELNEQGSPLAAADLSLSGYAPVTEPGTITVT